MADGMMNRNQESGIRNQWGGAAAPRLLITALCLLSPVLCCAEDLPDPTRPPASIFATAAGAGAGREATGNRTSGLRSVIISESRRAAIIDGKIVELGAKHGDARLIEVNERGVVLRGAHGRQVLTLFPGVKMTSAKITSKQEMKVKPPSPAGKVQSEK